ncbi:ABC transporter ATP-binding protein [Jannaschia sp. W003]|uniref:ABC transporter ATP-binding protein n=1 Tax=Jannaschia sp. W003 TaxID=2867012 RepID=UPI0021A85572|nr:ABC transporter ATP-binding protein [Jannaschia sp. W003]
MDLRIPSGALVALLGPSGCGKTTLLRSIAGLEPVAAGRIRFDGQDVTGLAPQHRGAGLVFQGYALFPHMTVARNVAFGLRMHGVPEPERTARVAAMLETVRLGAEAHRFPSQLSGGQRQRVALARTLVTEPAVLMLDEPLANLDTGLRAEMRRFIRALQRRLGITTVFVTHDQSEALEMADRVAVVLDGRIAQEGTPEAIYRRPATPKIAAFMGADNVLPARIEAGVAHTPIGAVPVAPGAHGSTVMLRAEVIDIGDAGLAGRIEARDFTGAAARYRVAVGGGHVTVTEPARRLLDPGTAVRLRIDPEAVWCFPGKGGGRAGRD